MSEELTTMAGAALADPVRRKVLAFVSRSQQPVGRDCAAEALGIPSSTAAFHLERLAEAGLLTTVFGPLARSDGLRDEPAEKLYRAIGRTAEAPGNPRSTPRDGAEFVRQVHPPPD